MNKYTVCGYDIDLVHAKMLEIAVEVDRICRENGFRCSLYGGSVLGAIRHDGFIPWDHDIDMAMPRKDYDLFEKYMMEHPNKKIFLSTYKTEKRYPNSWGKVRLNNTVFLEKELEELSELHQGIFIDLHPIDNTVPAILKLQVRLAMFWSCVCKVKSGIYKGSKRKTKMYGVFSWLSYSMINRFRACAMKLFKHFPTKYVYKIAHPNNGIYPMDRATFEDLIDHKFEEYSFKIPKNYDTFLRDRYGDYMKIPPESEVYECCTSIVRCEI